MRVITVWMNCFQDLLTILLQIFDRWNDVVRIILLLSTLLISRCIELWKICIPSLCSIDKLSFPSFRFSASSFSSQYLLLFLKSSRNCVVVLLLPTPFTSVVYPSVASWRKQFLLRIWPIQLVFRLRVLFRSVLFSPIGLLVHKLLSLAILSSPFSSCTTFQSSPNTSAPIFLVSRSLSHIKQCSKYNT